VSSHIAQNIGFAAAIVGTTYLSLIIGELVPKQLALRNPEPLACFVAPFMITLARVAAPIVWVLDQSSEVIFKLMRLKREGNDHVTAEELQLIVAEASRHGVIEESERAIISGVLPIDRFVR
jgi:putative hemolysin